MSNSAQIAFLNASGAQVGVLRIVSDSMNEGALVVVSAEEAREWGEEVVQLLEGRSYQFEFDGPRLRLDMDAPIVTHFQVGRGDGVDRGALRPGLHTGRLQLRAVDALGEPATAAVEVRSQKVGYRDDYREMLEQIASISLDLVNHITAPAEVPLTSDDSASDGELQQKLFFLRGVINSEEFDAAIQQILRQPHVAMSRVENERPIGRVARMSPALTQQLAGRTPRGALPEKHALRRLGLSSVPRTLSHTAFEDTLDTAENRFIKHALTSFSDTLLLLVDCLNQRGVACQALARREIPGLRQRLATALAADMFADIGRLSNLPNIGPVLQRKAGYREVTRAWLRFLAGNTLGWDAVDEVFGGGKRDIASLYEYWLFFQLWNVLTRLANDSREIGEATEALFERSGTGVGLRLRSGAHLLTPHMVVERNGARIALQFHYNKTFRSKTTPAPNPPKRSVSPPYDVSWTRAMRPDFSFTLWPADCDPSDAAERELLSVVHFDAKYSVENINSLFGDPELDMDEDKAGQRQGRYRRADLLKMHAYKDAVRRTAGAYVLYPGAPRSDGDDDLWAEFHEILPGLGAFVVRPSAGGDPAARVEAFLRDVISQLAARL